MLAVVLGAAAGGGFPQWNSNASACRRARSHDPAVRARSQASIAVSADGNWWFLFNASPDLRQQIQDNSVLHPRFGLRSSPIAGVVLTGGDVDAIAGLLTLRERQPLTLYATGTTLETLERNPIFGVLAPDMVSRRRLDLDTRVELVAPDGGFAGLTIETFAVPGKVPLYLEQGEAMPEIAETEQTVGIEVSDGRTRLIFVPGCAAMTGHLASRLGRADVVFFDGTLWTDDEMILAGIGSKTGRRMGHMSVSGPNGTLAAFEGIEVSRKIFLHINNSNPMLLDDSPERALVEQAGWEVAFDGMELRT